MGSLELLSEPRGICVRNEFLGEALLRLLPMKDSLGPALACWSSGRCGSALVAPRWLLVALGCSVQGK